MFEPPAINYSFQFIEHYIEKVYALLLEEENRFLHVFFAARLKLWRFSKISLNPGRTLLWLKDPLIPALVMWHTQKNTLDSSKPMK